MNKQIALLIIMTALIASTASAAKYFVIEVKYFSGSLVFDGIGLRDVEYAQNQYDSSGFLVKTISFEEQLIGSLQYNISENRKYIIYVPYSKDAARIEIANPSNSTVMDLDVSSFADTCGNNVCEMHESYESCTKDCSSGSQDDFCDELNDGICDPDCSPKTDADCKLIEQIKSNATLAAASKMPERSKTKQAEEPKEKPNYLIWILSASVVVVIAILLFLLIRKRKENQIVSSLNQYISDNIRHGYALQQIKEILYREGYTEKEIDKAIKSIG